MSNSNAISTRSKSSDHVSAAAASLQLLLREDPLLQHLGLTNSGSSTDKVAFPYAAALLKDNAGGTNAKQRADLALQDVERKLALVESLAVKLSRTSPEAVAGHLLRLHGYNILPESGTDESTTGTIVVPTSTLQAIRDRADRLTRQAETLDSITARVENSLTKGLARMDAVCTRLERVLKLSSTLKMILRLQFENNKLQNYDLEDLRDLTRAAASVAVLEELLANPEVSAAHQIAVVERMRPEVESTAHAVRQAANAVLQEQLSQPSKVQLLGATLQVYYHLGELSAAVWKAVDHAHSKAEAACRRLWSPLNIASMSDQAKKTAKESRLVQKRLREIRVDATNEWVDEMAEIANQIRNLQFVLSRRTDPVRRVVYIDVVASSRIPGTYQVGRNEEFSLFKLFWLRCCATLSDIIRNLLSYDQGRLKADVSGLYPAVRSGSLAMVGRLLDVLPTAVHDDVSSSTTAGILGGSFVLDDTFLEWTTCHYEDSSENPQAAASASTWTRTGQSTAPNTFLSTSPVTMFGSDSVSSVFLSFEWQILNGNPTTRGGVYPLQQAFFDGCLERLRAPLQYMFPENVAVDEDGVAVAQGFNLPSKYDIQRFDETIRQELQLADPREGAGDLTAVAMIAECVVAMIGDFCSRAKNALSGKGDSSYLTDDWVMTETLLYDRKVVAIMYTLAGHLRSAPEKTFVAPYRPAISSQHEETANKCKLALAPAIEEIDRMVKTTVLAPLCRALNRRLASVLAKIHLGVYIESPGASDDESPSFVQKQLAPAFEAIAEFLPKFPPPYAFVVAGTVAKFSIYAFISHAMLVRPLGESAKLHITQDLTDLELSLEQLVARGGGSKSLAQIDGGRPYAELRAVRQMLFWSGLDDKKRRAEDVAKALLREVWVKDVRPSTVFSSLFGYAPALLSSPHHTSRKKADEYVNMLVGLDGSTETGEDSSWMITLSSCDSYQQRASSLGTAPDGDARIAQIIMSIGQELFRRREH